jgi:DNA (cytosine-5)-methyltransferase 3A
MVDLLIGGSPCQGFSFAGKQLNFFDPRSKLFYDYVKALEVLKPKYFLLENVKMKKEYEDIISQNLGVKPIEINSALVSAQNRVRLYWTNIPGIQKPKDKGILLKDIIVDGEVDRDKSYCIDSNYYKGGNIKQYFEKHRRQIVFTKKFSEDFKFRMLYPIECERLQNLSDDYTAIGVIDGKKVKISNRQRYIMLGNAWTADVITHIFSFIPDEHLNNVVSLFDGISCGQVALEKAGKIYKNYYASEVDKYAIAVTRRNYPKTVQLGDVTKIDWNVFLENMKKD